MMPCKFCGQVDHLGRDRRGIRQFGKTKSSGVRFVRRYRCLDCGAVCMMTGDVKTNAFIDAWKSNEPGSQFVVDARGFAPEPHRDQAKRCTQGGEQDNTACPARECLDSLQNGKSRGLAAVLANALPPHPVGLFCFDSKEGSKLEIPATTRS